MAYTNNPEQPINYFQASADIAKTAITWPAQQYLYNPGMYSLTRGQVRLPTSGIGLKKFAGTLRKIPYGNRVVDWTKRTFDIDTSSNVMRSKEIWWGLGSDKSRFSLGLHAVVDPVKQTSYSPIIGMKQASNIDSWNAPLSQPINRNLPRMRGEVYITGYRPISKMRNIAKQATSIIEPSYMNHLADSPRIFNPKLPKAIGEIPVTGSVYRPVTQTATMTSGLTKRDISYLKFSKGLEKVARKPKWYNLAYGGLGGGKKLATFAGRTAVRAGILGMKGFAYYQVGKLMWDAINYVMEPVGRASVQAVDQAFRAYESVPQVEMGGQIAMSYLTQGAATERQRSLQAISKAHINGRSALGQEASYTHR